MHAHVQLHTATTTLLSLFIPQLLSAVDLHSQPGLEIVVVGDPAAASTKQLLHPLHTRFASLTNPQTVSSCVWPLTLTRPVHGGSCGSQTGA